MSEHICTHPQDTWRQTRIHGVVACPVCWPQHFSSVTDPTNDECRDWLAAFTKATGKSISRAYYSDFAKFALKREKQLVEAAHELLLKTYRGVMR